MAAIAVFVMLLALALAWFFWFPPGPEPFVVHLAGSGRADERALTAPPDRPLVLHIEGTVSPPDAVSWEVSVVEAASGAEVFSEAGVRSGERELLVNVPQGLSRAGRYDVRATAQGGAATRPLELNLHFYIAPAP
jgi:hypothetical protein